jgi:hypothetical protein
MTGNRCLCRVLAPLWVSVFLVACAPAESTAMPRWVISANFYSGRANPQGFLTGEQVDELLALIAALDAAPPANSGALGYSGFTVRPAGPAVTDIQSITVYNGTVAVTRGGATTYLADSGRQLERWLLGQVEDSAWLTAAEKQAIQNQLPVEAGP